MQSKLNYDLEHFNLKKNEFEKYKETEIKKLEKEKKLINLLKTQNETLIQNSKKDKETIENLKNQIYQLQLEMKNKENENKITIGKLKKQIEELKLNQNNNKYISEHSSTNNILKNSQNVKTNEEIESPNSNQLKNISIISKQSNQKKK